MFQYPIKTDFYKIIHKEKYWRISPDKASEFPSYRTHENSVYSDECAYHLGCFSRKEECSRRERSRPERVLISSCQVNCHVTGYRQFQKDEGLNGQTIKVEYPFTFQNNRKLANTPSHRGADHWYPLQ